MTDSADDNAIRFLMNDYKETEQRLTSARHLENSETEEAFSALLDIARNPREEDALLRAVGRSLAKVAKALSREDDVTGLSPAAKAAYSE